MRILHRHVIHQSSQRHDVTLGQLALGHRERVSQDVSALIAKLCSKATMQLHQMIKLIIIIIIDAII